MSSGGGALSPAGGGHSPTEEGDKEEDEVEEEGEREEGEEEEEEEEEEENSSDSVSWCLCLLCGICLFADKGDIRYIHNHTHWVCQFYSKSCGFCLPQDDSMLAEWVPTRTSSQAPISSVKVSCFFFPPIQWAAVCRNAFPVVVVG